MSRFARCFSLMFCMFPVGTKLAKSCLDSNTFSYIVQVYSYACFRTPINYDLTKYIKL